jgi:hypothetical protein
VAVPSTRCDNSVMVNVTCENWGAVRPPELAEIHRNDRPPCTSGSTGIRHDGPPRPAVNARLVISVTASQPQRDWERRWRETERDLGEVLALHTEAMSGAAIHAANHRLQGCAAPYVRVGPSEREDLHRMITGPADRHMQAGAGDRRCLQPSRGRRLTECASFGPPDACWITRGA